MKFLNKLTIEKMKKVIVIAKYEAYVPDDMTVSQIQDDAEEEIRNQFDSFSIYVKDYPNEDDSSPIFNLDDVMCGTESMISVGGD